MPPRPPLILISSLFLLIQRGEPIKAYLTSWQRAKTFINKEVKPPSKWRPARWSQASILHKPNQKKKKRVMQSHKTLHLATCKCAGQAWARCNSCDCMLFKAKSTGVSAAVPDSVWIIHVCQSESQFGHSTQKERIRDACTTFTNLPIYKPWCEYLLLCSIMLRRRRGLVPKQTLFHPEDPNSSRRFLARTLPAEVSLSSSWRVRSHWKQF